jgi:protein gp37
MGLKTKIEYVSATHNFWYGCTKVSEGCKNCFAERIYKRFYGNDFSKIIKSKNFDAPLKWKKPRVILVNDMSDFFHDNVPFKWFDNAIEIMACAYQHIFLLLTKRARNIKKLFNINELKYDCPPNIWLGVSVENQKTADERIPELLKIPHFKKWISVEPMLDEINTRKYLKDISWVVCGGETGKGARPLKREWLNHLFKGQCKFEGVPFFMKQMSNREPIPKDLMVREYPPEIKEIMNANNQNKRKTL